MSIDSVASRESPAFFRNEIVPALHRIQAEYGYLNRNALEEYSKNTGIPLYRLHEVASYFPFFHFKEPPAVTVKICQNMACHMSGATHILAELEPFAKENAPHVHIEGVSCLGRCDAAPIVCVSAAHKPAAGASTNGLAGQVLSNAHGDESHGAEEEFYLSPANTTELREAIQACLTGKTKHLQSLGGRHGSGYPSPDWLIDPYKDGLPKYQAIRNLLEARDGPIREASRSLIEQLQIPESDVPQFLQTLKKNSKAQQEKSPKWVEAAFKEFDCRPANGPIALRGLGGAGVPASQKWRDVREAVINLRERDLDDRAFILVNGDESEPGTFKDRELLLHYPHLVIEGVILAGIISDATEGFIYIRHEYPEQIEACEKAIKEAERMGVCGMNAYLLGKPFPVSVFVSPGGYICGEQSALINALEGHRGEPRNLPPQPQTNGLEQQPTLVSNVETYAWAPYILVNGGAQYCSLGNNGWGGRRFFSVSGDVNRPGVYEVPMGLTLRELLHGDQYCQGISGTGKLKAFAPSGPSGGFIPAILPSPRDPAKNKAWIALAARRGFPVDAQQLDILDMELELDLWRALSPTGMLGAGLIVYDDTRDMAEQSVNSLEFFRNESCGKCVPCRLGSQKLTNLGENVLDHVIDSQSWHNEIFPLVKELVQVMSDSSICGLGRSFQSPISTLTDYFSSDLERHLLHPTSTQ
ncbi:MAG TPA: NAD(P)H-dependent oxidoreductase subunit E [Bryobacteraceae bacterium]|nr:NAD(P)H-dependent oxidoreductase subunit E [Bryobacteraceae bacterium]